MQGPQSRVFSLQETWSTSQKCARQNPDNQYSDKTEVKHIDMEEQSPDYAQSEYTTPYYLTKDQAKASVKCFKTTARVHHMRMRRQRTHQTAVGSSVLRVPSLSY